MIIGHGTLTVPMNLYYLIIGNNNWFLLFDIHSKLT